MARVAKKRLDQILVERGLAESRTRTQALIMAGKVFTDNRRLDKAGQMLAEDQVLKVKGQEHPWVSRGGVKLAAGLSHFAIEPRGAVAIDVGAAAGLAPPGTPARGGSRRVPRACGSVAR